jgi:HPt (histidine-containing phosphotransfer) domain-containing protein
MAEPDAVDRQALDALMEATGGDPNFLAEMMDVFFDDSGTQLAVMQQALAEGSAEELRRAAHSLKANSASFGAVALAGLCQEMETRGESARLDGADELLTRMQAQYAKVRDALEQARPAM